MQHVYGIHCHLNEPNCLMGCTYGDIGDAEIALGIHATCFVHGTHLHVHGTHIPMAHADGTGAPIL